MYLYCIGIGKGTIANAATKRPSVYVTMSGQQHGSAKRHRALITFEVAFVAVRQQMMRIDAVRFEATAKDLGNKIKANESIRSLCVF